MYVWRLVFDLTTVVCVRIYVSMYVQLMSSLLMVYGLWVMYVYIYG